MLSRRVTLSTITFVLASLVLSAAVPVLAISAPTLSAANESAGIRLTWNAVAGAEKYVIRRDDGSGFVQIANQTTTGYLDTAVTGGQEYSYKVRVVGTDGTDNASNVVTITRCASCATPTPPATPTPTASATATPTPQPTTSPSSTPVPTPTPTPTPPTTDPRLTCSGYPEPRVFLETQDWWRPIPAFAQPTDGHVHLGMCFPLGQTISGSVTFDVRVLIHENKGTWTRLKGQDDLSNNFYLEKPNVENINGGLLTFWRKVVVNTNNMPDGNRLFRWYADIEHDNGNTQTARAQWWADVQNGKADNDGSTRLAFMNWYFVDRDGPNARDWGYVGPELESLPTSAGVIDVKCNLNGTGGSPSIYRMIVARNPNVHAGDFGTIVYDGAPFSGTIDAGSPGDTVMVRCLQRDLSTDEFHEGVGVIPIK